MLADRDRRFGISTQEKRESRVNLTKPPDGTWSKRMDHPRARSPRRLGALAFVVLGLAVFPSCAKARRPATAPTPGTRMHAIVPAPVSVSLTPDVFLVSPQTVIVVDPPDETMFAVGRLLADLLGAAPESNPLVRGASGETPPNSITIAATATDPSLGDEGYDLVIAPDRVTITATSPAGAFYGVQTLRQLLPPIVEYEAARRPKEPLAIPAGHIRDVPRFAWRGAMLDVARHFFSPAEMKRYIDLLSLYKVNRLHLHLADDQGWRLEIKSWPDLTRIGGQTEVGGGPGGFYTQDEYADVVRYARERFITIVPEIDMPGHTHAALASYPELNCDGVAPKLYIDIQVGFSALCVEKEITYRFLDDVIREIAALTPGPFFHVGGDEVKTLTPEQYVAFIERVQGIVETHGKRMIGWDEVAAARLLPRSVVQHWRPKASHASLRTAPALIMSPGSRMYLDMKYDRSTILGLDWAGLIEVRDAYEWDPATLVEGVSSDVILGVEAPLWSETIACVRDLEFLAFPRVVAAAEIGWSRAEDRRWEEFRRRLGAQAPRWVALGINFYRSPQVDWAR
jgi:hexosaminidase